MQRLSDDNNGDEDDNDSSVRNFSVDSYSVVLCYVYITYA